MGLKPEYESMLTTARQSGSGSVLKRMVLPAIMVLLRSMSCATAVEKTAYLPTQGKSVFQIRLAKRSDIPNIRNCNLENLPENYSDDFFRRHLATWPQLSIVAEENDEFVGYALGRVEISPTQSPKPKAVIGKVTPNVKPIYRGHVTSIAVNSPYRGRGVAKNLMETLHSQFACVHNADEVSLHCRVSNIPAIRLYVNIDEL